MWRTKITAFLLTSLVAGVAAGYTLVLKDGSRMVAREKYEVQGDTALITLLNGTQTRIDLVEIDIERTEVENAQGALGTAIVVTERGAERYRSNSQRPAAARTLSDLIRERQQRAAAQDGDADATDAEGLSVRTTAAGFNDLSSLRRTPHPSDAITDRVSSLLTSGGVSQFRIFQGTQPEYVFVEAVASNEDEVFEALGTLAEVAMTLDREHDDVSGLEVLLTAKNRSRAGQFLFTPENAPLLINERMTTSDFFLEYVEY